MRDTITKQIKEVETKELNRKSAFVACEQALLMIERDIQKGEPAETTVIGLLTVIQKMVEVLK